MAKVVIQFPRREAAFYNLLAHKLRAMSLFLPALEQELQTAIEAAGAKATANGLRGKALADFVQSVGESEFNAIDEYKAGISAAIWKAIRLGESLNLEMLGCRRLAESLRGGFDKRNPLTLTFDAVVELERMLDHKLLVRSKGSDTTNKSTGRNRESDDEAARRNHERWEKFKVNDYLEPRNKPPRGIHLGSVEHYIWWGLEISADSDIPDSAEAHFKLERYYRRHHKPAKMSKRKRTTKRRGR